MILACPNIGDDHAAGPHRIVIPIYTVSKRDRDNRKIVHISTRMGKEAIICAICDHWVARFVIRCHCPCHRSE